MKLPPNETNPNHHPLCSPEHCVQVFGKRGSVVLKISDTCPECADFDVDIADEIYPKLDDPVKGRVRMSWQFIDCNTNPPGTETKTSSSSSLTFMFKLTRNVFKI